MTKVFVERAVIRCSNGSVRVLSRYMACPTDKHVEAAKKVISYLYRTKGFGIRYCRSPKAQQLEGPHVEDALLVYRHTKLSSALQNDAAIARA